MTTNLPAVLDESNIDNSDLETQVEFYRANIQKLETFSTQIESVVDGVEAFAKTVPEFVNLAMKCGELNAKIQVLQEQIHYLLYPDSPMSNEYTEQETDQEQDEEELSAKLKKRYGFLKKKIARLLHPDKTKSEFNHALYHTAMRLLELHDFDSVEKLLNDFETSRNKKASKYSKAQARDSLRSMLDDLKMRFNRLNSEIMQRLHSNEGIIYKVASNYGIQSRITLGTVMNIQSQALHNLESEHWQLQQKLNTLKNPTHKFSHDESDFTV